MTRVGLHLLGRSDPPDMDHVLRRPRAAASPGTVERRIETPRFSYDQGDTPMCVGFAIGRVLSHLDRDRHDARALYRSCKQLDPWPGEQRTSARYAFDALGQRHPSAERRSWCRSVDEVRAAIDQGSPVALGLSWARSWLTPEPRDEEWWLPAYDVHAGGHQIGAWAASDRRQAVGLANTWGSAYPRLVWMPYAELERQLRGGLADAGVIEHAPLAA
jgi:hypothetical protein